MIEIHVHVNDLSPNEKSSLSGKSVISNSLLNTPHLIHHISSFDKYLFYFKNLLENFS